MKHKALSFITLLAAGSVALLLSACAGSRTADIDVTAFATWGNAGLPVSGSTYRFDRLPSQQPGAGQDSQLETITRDALSRKGLQLASGSALPRYSVQVSTSAQRMAGPGNYPYGPTINVGAMGGSGGFSAAGIGFGFPIGGSSSSEYRTELVLLVRNLQNNTIAYEARAYSQDGFPGDSAVLAAMAESALRDFPVPPVGIKRYRIELPR
jgi:hypothetical protein